MLITGTDFIDGAVNFDTCHYVERERYEQDKHIQIRNGSILITKDGTLGKVAYIQGLTMPATLNAGVFNVEIKDENEVDNRYLFQYLKASFLMDYVDKKATGGTIKHLNQNILVDFPVVLPHKAEQEKIGEYFLAIDHLITLHQREFAFLCKEKSKKFRYIKNAWEQRKLGEIVLRESLARESTIDLPYVEYEDVIAEEGRINKDIRKKEGIKKGIFFDGSQVLYGKLRPYLHNWLNPDFSGVAVGDWWVLKPNNVDKNFIYRLIQTQQFDDIANQSTGSKMPRADWNLVSNTEFAIPTSQVEQTKIGGYFFTLDNLITLHQRKPNFYTGGYYAE